MFEHFQNGGHEPEVAISHHLRRLAGPCKELYFIASTWTWLRTIEQDLRPLNIGLVSAWQRAQDRERWRRTPLRSRLGHAFDDDDDTINPTVCMPTVCDTLVTHEIKRDFTNGINLI